MPSLPLTTSYWPADTTQPVLETTIGGVLRAAAERAPTDRADRGRPRPGPPAAVDATPSCSPTPSGPPARWLTRFAPGEPVAVWAATARNGCMLEFAAGLAGLTLVTGQPGLPGGRAGVRARPLRRRGLFLAAAPRQPLPRSWPSPRPPAGAARGDVARRMGRLLATGTGGRAARRRPGSPAQIQYTSGTTGCPKGAVLTTAA